METTICLICGDKGCSNAFVYCVNCLEVAVHRYCLDKVTFNEFVNWVCDDCEVNEYSSSSSATVPSITDEVEHRDVVQRDVVERRDVAQPVHGPICEVDEHSSSSSAAVPPITDVVEHRDVVQPVHDPIWRGRFNITNKNYTLDGVAAHLSVKANQSVSEKAELLLPNLNFEMFHKLELWPQTSNTPKASADDIELYFFPSEARYDQDYDHFVEEMMIDGEHALRALTPHGDLLVFSSIELPARHWRYNQKCYLWGIFRARQGCRSRRLVSNRIQSGTARQTTENQLAGRDAINLVNDRIPAEEETQVLRRSNRTPTRNVRFADYDCSKDIPAEEETKVLRRSNRNTRRNVRLADYDCSKDESSE